MQSKRQIYGFYNSVNYTKITHFSLYVKYSFGQYQKANTTCPFLPQNRNNSEVILVNLAE